MMTVQSLRKKFLPVIQDSQIEMSDSIQISSNGKTGHSINLSILETCQPTKECSKYCYGIRGPSAFSNSIKAQHRNTLRFQYLETAPFHVILEECEKIYSVLNKSGKNWIRWNGVGDLIPGSIRVINAFAEIYPDIIHWVVTRKVREAAQLKDLSNIRILFSLDKSTPEKIKNEALNLSKNYKNGIVRYSWTQRDMERAPEYIDIVFNEHILRKRSVFNQDFRVCEATLPNHSHLDSCNSCRRCFA